jgi:ubiquinone/menaquinone biosynthesis C-methylase UbiE
MAIMEEKSLDPSEFLDGTFWEISSKNIINRIIYTGFFNTIKKISGYIEPTAKILEAGCGVGFTSLRIKKIMPESNFEISDVNETFVRNMVTNNFPIKITQESVLSMQREDRSFDCVFLLEVLEHVDDFEKALSELFRVSRNYVVISVPNEPLWSFLNLLRGKYFSQKGNTPGHINHWTPKSFKKLISKYGNVIKVYLPLPWIFVLAKVKSDLI